MIFVYSYTNSFYNYNLVLISTLFAAKGANLSFVEMDRALMYDISFFYFYLNDYQLRDMEKFDNYL